MRHVVGSKVNNDPPVLASLHYASGQYPNTPKQQCVRRIRPNSNNLKTDLYRKSNSACNCHFTASWHLLYQNTIGISISIYQFIYPLRLNLAENSTPALSKTHLGYSTTANVVTPRITMPMTLYDFKTTLERQVDHARVVD